MQRSLLPVAARPAVIGAGAAVGLVEGLDLAVGASRRPRSCSRPHSGRRATPATATPASRRATSTSATRPGVVFVRAQIVQRTQSPFDFGLPQEQRGEATGSGFVIDKAGTILTNAHVVNGATKVSVQFQNKQSVDAKVLGKDESTDLALLQVDPAGSSCTR